MRILLIDDEQMVRKIVRKMLERAGHEVIEAENGRLGLEQLGQGAFDLVLTDIIMPEMEGVETVMSVREHHPSVKIIAMSGGGRTGNMDFLATAQKLGAAAILNKPFTIASLNEAMEKAFKS
jgi:DNA-binding NtrC family response regulator